MSEPKDSSKKLKRLALLFEFAGLCGLAMLGTGLWWYDPKISLIVIGLILIFLAFFVCSIIGSAQKKGNPKA